MEQKGGYWLTSGRMGKHKAILLDEPNVTTGVTSVLNSATLLPSLSKKEILQNCLEVLKTTYPSQLDLTGKPLSEADWDLFTDGSSFGKDSQTYAGHGAVEEELRREGSCSRPACTPTSAHGADCSTQSSNLIKR